MTDRRWCRPDWNCCDAEDAVGADVVHAAVSDTFTIYPSASSPSAGSVRLWFVYGDFMTWRPPWRYANGPRKGKPLKKEHDGGILVQFRTDWRRCPKRPFRFTVTQEIPNRDTRFNWRAWINRRAEWDTPNAEPRLSDRIK